MGIYGAQRDGAAGTAALMVRAGGYELFPIATGCGELVERFRGLCTYSVCSGQSPGPLLPSSHVSNKAARDCRPCAVSGA